MDLSIQEQGIAESGGQQGSITSLRTEWIVRDEVYVRALVSWIHRRGSGATNYNVQERELVANLEDSVRVL